MDDIFKGLGIEITLAESDDFLKVKETLTRIGVSSARDKTLYQSCHILHKRGRYVILHFKELFILDGKPSSISEEDIGRRNTIVGLLKQWGLVTLLNEDEIEQPTVPINKIKIISFSEKNDWDLVAKYTIGGSK